MSEPPAACRCLIDMLSINLPGARAYCDKHRSFGIKLDNGRVAAAPTAAGLPVAAPDVSELGSYT